jgi:hypothetical protein
MKLGNMREIGLHKKAAPAEHRNPRRISSLLMIDVPQPQSLGVGHASQR